MLARSALNSTLWDAEKSHNLCIYLNLKRLCLPEQFDSDLFNRIFSVFIYDEVSKQLLQILSGLSEENKLKQFLSMFNTQKRKVKENLEKAILSLYEIKQIAYNGNERFSELSTGSLETESYDHLLDEFSTQLNESLTLTDAGFSFDINASSLEEISERLKTNNTYMQYLNVQSVRNQLNSIISFSFRSIIACQNFLSLEIYPSVHNSCRFNVNPLGKHMQSCEPHLSQVSLFGSSLCLPTSSQSMQ